MSKIVGPKTTRRKFFLLIIIDRSGSMYGVKLDSVNYAIGELVPDLQKLQAEVTDKEFLVQVITFDTDGHRVYAEPIPVDEWDYVPIESGSQSNLGAGLDLATEELEAFAKKLTIASVIMLFSDGAVDNYKNQQQRMLNTSMGKKACRIPFAIGDDADIEMLTSFKSADQDGVSKIKNAGDLVELIKFKTIAAVDGATVIKTKVKGNEGDLLPPQELNAALFDDGVLDDDREAKIREAGIDPDMIL